MPELLTKHPDIVIKVLKSEGAQCGTGAAPKILTKCPPEKFCTLAGGELCVYGSNDLGRMTQLSSADLCRSSPDSRSSLEVVPPTAPSSPSEHVLVGAMPVAIVLVGVGLAGLARRLR